MKTKWDEIIETCPLSFDLIARNADPYTKQNFPKNAWIYDSNIPTTFEHLPTFFEANGVVLKDPQDNEQFFAAFNELEKSITEWNKNKIK